MMNGHNSQISRILTKRIWRLSCWPAKYRYDHHHQPCRQIASKGIKKTLWSNSAFGQLWSNSTSQTHNDAEVEQLLNSAGKVYCFRIIGSVFVSWYLFKKKMTRKIKLVTLSWWTIIWAFEAKTAFLYNLGCFVHLG